MEIFALIILVVFSVVGFAAIFFTTFGTLIILIGSILYALLTGFSIINIKILLLLIVLYFFGEVIEYLSVIIGIKKIGASNAAIAGAIVGGIIGAVVGVGFFGVGLILSTFLGIFLGAALVELFIRKDLIKSLKAGTGGIFGRIGSIIAKIVIAIAMLVIIVTRIISYSG